MFAKSLTLFYINLGGEMIYILDQRLRTQGIKETTILKILGDLIGKMFSQKTMFNIFRSTNEVDLDHSYFKNHFREIVHSSLIKLNANSMDKLYDLMVMTVKQQTLSLKSPQDILLMTLNHIDGMAFATLKIFNKSAEQIFKTLYSQIKDHYCESSYGILMLYKSSFLHFTRNLYIRVSVYLKEKMQMESGHFIFSGNGVLPFGFLMTGTIRFFQCNKITTEPFRTGLFKLALPTIKYSMSSCGERGIDVGKNIYDPYSDSFYNEFRKKQQNTSHSNSMANKKEMDILERMIVGCKVDDKQTLKGDEEQIKIELDIFGDDEEEQEFQMKDGKQKNINEEKMGEGCFKKEGDINKFKNISKNKTNILNIDASEGYKNQIFNLVNSVKAQLITTQGGGEEGDESRFNEEM